MAAGARAARISDQVGTMVLQVNPGVTWNPIRPYRTLGASSTPKPVGLSAGVDDELTSSTSAPSHSRYAFASPT